MDINNGQVVHLQEESYSLADFIDEKIDEFHEVVRHSVFCFEHHDNEISRIE